MLGQHRVLGTAAQRLRAGTQGSRTNVRFDDDTMSLVLDYRVGDGPWKRLRPDQAAEVVGRQGPKVGIEDTTAEDFESLLQPVTGANRVELGRKE